MSYELGLGQWETAAIAAAPAIGSSLGGLIGGLGGLFAGGKNKPKDCCDMCTGATVGTMMSGPSCATQWRRSAACDQFSGGKLPDAMFKQYMASQGISSCADPSGGTPVVTPQGLGTPGYVTTPTGQVVPASSVSSLGSSSSIMSFITSPIGLIAVFFGGILLLRRK